MVIIDMITPSREPNALPDIHQSDAGMLLRWWCDGIPRAPSIGLGFGGAEQFARQTKFMSDTNENNEKIQP